MHYTIYSRTMRGVGGVGRGASAGEPYFLKRLISAAAAAVAAAIYVIF